MLEYSHYLSIRKQLSQQRKPIRNQIRDLTQQVNRLKTNIAEFEATIRSIKSK